VERERHIFARHRRRHPVWVLARAQNGRPKAFLFTSFAMTTTPLVSSVDGAVQATATSPVRATCDLCDVYKNDSTGAFRVLAPVFRDFGALRRFAGPGGHGQVF